MAGVALVPPTAMDAAVEQLRQQEGGQEIIDSCNVAAGLSLGEYTALCFAGAISFEDGLKIVKARGEAMQVRHNFPTLSLSLSVCPLSFSFGERS